MSVPENIQRSRVAFGLRVQECREAQDLTQTQLASIAGISRSSISRIESGQTRVSLDAIVLIANALGISPSDLLSGIAAPTYRDPSAIPLTL